MAKQELYFPRDIDVFRQGRTAEEAQILKKLRLNISWEVQLLQRLQIEKIRQEHIQKIEYASDEDALMELDDVRKEINRLETGSSDEESSD
jgi:hypothetical protein